MNARKYFCWLLGHDASREFLKEMQDLQISIGETLCEHCNNAILTVKLELNAPGEYYLYDLEKITL